MASLCRRAHFALEALSATGFQCRVAIRTAADRSLPMHDLLFLALGLAGFGALVAYARLCDRS